jgi:hypothetical protein
VVALADDGRWSYVRPGPVLERWRSLTLGKDLVDSFRGVFDTIGVRIIDTGEALTCTHRGDRIEFAAGINDAAVGFAVSIYAYQAERLAAQIERGRIDDVEWFRVARELFANAGASSRVVQNPLSSNPMLRRLIGAKNLVHVILVSPAPQEEPDAPFSLIHVNRRSLLVPGLHGTPDRVLRVTFADALELQRKLTGAPRSGRAAWLELARWYQAWRRKVEA